MMPSRDVRRSNDEAALTRALIAFTLVCGALFGVEVGRDLAARVAAGPAAAIFEQALFAALALALLYGNLVYQFTRLGALQRRGAHRRATAAELQRVHAESAPPSLAILVPSYREEPAVVRRTLLSAALQEHPRRRVVLLIDDPPQPRDAQSAAALAAMRELPGAIAELLEKPAQATSAALAAFSEREREGELDLVFETARAAELHGELASWFESRARDERDEGHDARWFCERVLRARARELSDSGLELEERARRGAPLDAVALRGSLRRLAALFRVEIGAFERKRYVNLSHTPNKAMNLNAYLGLLGGCYRAVERGDGSHLVPAALRDATLVVPCADFVITLDADSILAPEYALDLLARIRAPGAERVAVIQTPYSAFPDAPGVLERVAGATTDIQYRIHQGFTRWNATYWVGANALLRWEALQGIATQRRERGFAVPVFVSDRTVIEDTESSVDLIAAGWTLENVPERLAWSATPSDFGSLVIQRRRWANGGLLILPKLLRALASAPWTARRAAEGALRVHYLISIAIVNAALVALLAWPFDQALRSAWFPLASLPYFFLYGRDLVQLGYRASDLPRAYALQLLLLPVHLAGVGHSLVQALTGRKAAFARTPKVPGRTAAPVGIHGAGLAVLVGMAAVIALDLRDGHWVHASFAALNAFALAYALHVFVGWRDLAGDVRAALRAR